MGQTTALVLASASPRRRELLQSLGLSFEVDSANADESVGQGEAPRAYAMRVARAKADAVARRRPDAVVLAADTTVVLDGSILGKPTDAGDAVRMLKQLSGRQHRVVTAVALAGAANDGVAVETTVWFRELGDRDIAWYVSTGEPMDKAGSYAIQGAGGMLVRRIDGSASNVVGLPLSETVELLAKAGFPMPWSGP